MIQTEFKKFAKILKCYKFIYKFIYMFMSFVKIIVAHVKKLSCDHFFLNKNGLIPAACEIAGVVCDVPLSWLEVLIL